MLCNSHVLQHLGTEGRGILVLLCGNRDNDFANPLDNPEGWGGKGGGWGVQDGGHMYTRG